MAELRQQLDEQTKTIAHLEAKLAQAIALHEEAESDVDRLDCENQLLTEQSQELEGVYAELWSRHKALQQQVNPSTKYEAVGKEENPGQKSNSPEINFFADDGDTEIQDEDGLNMDEFPKPSIYLGEEKNYTAQMQPPIMMQPTRVMPHMHLPFSFGGPLSMPSRPMPYSSKISTDLTERPNFIRSVLQLPSKGIDTAENLQALRGRIIDEDPSEYFRQFTPYILEEVRSQISKQQKVIAKKGRLPFPITLKTQLKANSGSDTEDSLETDDLEMQLTFTTEKGNLPKLDHGFFNEAVLIIFDEPENRSRKYGRKATNKEEKLEGMLAIASVKPNYDDDEEDKNKKKKVDIKLTFPSRDLHAALLPAFEKNKNTIWLHWLCGLTPSERMFDVCSAMPKSSFQRQFIEANLDDWPEALKQSSPPDAPPAALARLNPIQASIVQRLQENELGLKLLVGPPGTGKTTTAISWLMHYVNQHPDQRILICTPSNQALRVLLHEAIKNLPPTTAMALTGIAKKLPVDLRRVYVHGVAGDFFKLLIFLKRALSKEDKRNNLLQIQSDILAHIENIENTLAELISTESRMNVKDHIARGVGRLLSDLQMRKEELQQLSNEAIEKKNSQALRNNFVVVTEAVISLIQGNSSYLESYLTQRAQIVFATLVSSGRKWLKKQIDHFDVVLLDEAAQALVPEALIPLSFSPNLYIQIGDPNQLPATITSQEAQNKHYENSMMHWLIKEFNQPHEMLKIQYRMHQDICRWISHQYYDGKLITADRVKSRQSILQTNTKLAPEFKRPSLFFNIHGEENRRDGSDLKASCYNQAEAQAVISMACYLIIKCKFAPSQIGVITFYSEQLRILNECLNQAFRDKRLSKDIEINTVDGFQGGEKDIILASVVRTSESVGFLNDWRRLNVAMSRAKHARWVFGMFEPLSKSNSDMPSFLNDCSESHAIVSQEEFNHHVRNQFT